MNVVSARFRKYFTGIMSVMFLLVFIFGPAVAVEEDPSPIQVNGLPVTYTPFATSVNSGEVIDIQSSTGEVLLRGPDVRAGQLEKHTPDSIRWIAPTDPGQYSLTVDRPGNDRPVDLTVFVTVPADQVEDGHLNGYEIGSYPPNDGPNNSIYDPPEGFVEVTPQNRDTPLSPHFTLGDFLCNQPGDFPKYVALRDELILKLEFVLSRLNEAGHDVDGFVVMSGYRTPAYNDRLGNVSNSRHLWGGAADIYVDDDGDGRMDDLNGDGESDWRDARWLADFVKSLRDTPAGEGLRGGVGYYGANSIHGPFVHVDVRGYAASWRQVSR